MGLVAVLAVAMFAAQPARTAHAATQITLPFSSFGRILVDPGSKQVFVSGDDSILVFDLAGNLITTITGETGAGAMLIVGTTLYVTLSSGAIDRIDPSTATETSPLVTGLTNPGDLTYANGLIWTTSGNSGSIELDSVDPAATTPAITPYPGAFNGTNQLTACAGFAVNHADDPSYLFAFACGSGPGTVERFDVSGSTPTQTATTIVSGAGVPDAAVTDDGTHVLATAHDGPVREYDASDLQYDGVSYSSLWSAVATTAANGSKLVVGSLVYTTVVEYPSGDPSQAPVSVGIGPTMTRGIAISPDGLTAFVVTTLTPETTPVTIYLNLLPLVALPPDGSPVPPTGVTAVAGVGAARVSWSPPSYHGKSSLTGYTVTSSGGASVSVDGSTLTALIAGLSPVPHTFTVAATNANGTSAPSAPSNVITPIAGGTYNPLSPHRIIDTRGGMPVHRLGSGATLNFQVAGNGGVPATGLSAVVLNVSVTNTTGTGYLTVYPTGAPRPTVSSLNWTSGRTVPNLVQTGVGVNGGLSFFVSAAADLIVDVEGWYGDSTDSYAETGLLSMQQATRWYDSRYISTANGGVHEPFKPGETRAIPFVTPYSGIPGDAEAVVLNVTVTSPSSAGWVTVFPTGTPRPNASNLNFRAGQTVANRVIVPLGPDGQVDFYNSSGTTDIIVDLNGWFTGPSDSPNGGSPFVTGAPSRIWDSRTCACKLPGGYFIDFSFTGDPIAALAINLTATDTTASGWLTVYPDDGTHQNGNVPNMSDLNFAPGQTVANAAIANLNGVMAFNVYNSNGYTNTIIDVDGLYLPAVQGLASTLIARVYVREPSRAPLMPKAKSSSRMYAPAA